MKCHVNIQWSTEVCHIFKKINLPFSFSSFSFPLFPSFSFCSPLPHFSFFSTAPFPPPLAIVFCTIYTPVADLFQPVLLRVFGIEKPKRAFYLYKDCLIIVFLYFCCTSDMFHSRRKRAAPWKRCPRKWGTAYPSNWIFYLEI